MPNELKDLEKRYKQLGEEIDAFKAKMTKDEKPEIDWLKMPVDTLVEVRDEGDEWYVIHFSRVHEQGYACFDNGTNSNTTNNFVCWKHIRLITNPPRPWFGGDCPVDPNIKIRIWMRNGEPLVVKAGEYNWAHGRLDGDIIAYQILGEDEG